jgi:ribA/ribD-fused uncharacterized protein
MTTHYDINWLTERFESGDTLKFVYFWGHINKYNEQVGKFCFSQWFESPFTIDNITYKTSEHWMMAHKALLFDDRINFEKIISCNKPGEAKELGRQVLNYDEDIWNSKKFDIVKLGNIHKFNQNPVFADYLIKTDDRILVEASPVDAIWGIGLSQNSKDIDNIYAWRGQNLLGFALMKVRDFLKQFGLFEPIAKDIATPWTKYPDIDSADMFWRMGKGEEYMMNFFKNYSSLSDREQTIYKLTHPAPYNWTHFYD